MVITLQWPAHACICMFPQAEKAAKEALASFGGSGLGSIPVRKIDLRRQLKREAEEMKEKEKQEGKGAKRPRTRYGWVHIASMCSGALSSL